MVSNIEKHVVFGTDLNAAAPPPVPASPDIVFHDRNTGEPLGFDDEMLARHLLLVGETGSGKTNVLNHIVAQLLARMRSDSSAKNDVLVLFDPKEELAGRFFEPDNSNHHIISGGRFSHYSDVWNIFAELLALGIGSQSSVELARDLASELFRESRSINNPFFPNAAKDLFCAIVIDRLRRGLADPSQAHLLSNRSLAQFFRQRISPAEIDALIRRNPKEYAYLKSYYGDTKKGLNEQGLGVFAVLCERVNALFQGMFERDSLIYVDYPNRQLKYSDNLFSARDAIRQKNAQVYFICYDPSSQSTLPVYKAIFNTLLKTALSQNGTGGRTYVVMDEARLLFPMEYLEHALNEGRSLGLRIIAAVQSVSQINACYGSEDEAEAILAGFTNLICLHSRDKKSRDLLSRRSGEAYYQLRYQISNPDMPWETPQNGEDKRVGKVVEDWDAVGLRQGEAILLLNNYQPFKYTFQRYPVKETHIKR